MMALFNIRLLRILSEVLCLFYTAVKAIFENVHVSTGGFVDWSMWSDAVAR